MKMCLVSWKCSLKTWIILRITVETKGFLKWCLCPIWTTGIELLWPRGSAWHSPEHTAITLGRSLCSWWHLECTKQNAAPWVSIIPMAAVIIMVVVHVSQDIRVSVRTLAVATQRHWLPVWYKSPQRADWHWNSALRVHWAVPVVLCTSTVVDSVHIS